MKTLHPLPPVQFPSVTFNPVRPIEISRTQGRVIQSRVEPFPYWEAEFTLPPMPEGVAGKVRSFLMKTKLGGTGIFLAYNPRRPRPIQHDNGQPLGGVRADNTPFDGTAILQTVTDDFTVAVEGLPAGFKLTEGDYVSFQDGEQSYSLHVITDDAQADGSGVATLNFEHALFTQKFAAGSVVHFEQPACTMQVTQYELTETGAFSQGSFSAVEIHL